MFDDEIQLKELVQLTNQRKGQCREGYSLNKNNVFCYLVKKWGVHEEFRGNYVTHVKGHKLLTTFTSVLCIFAPVCPISVT